MTLLDGFYQLGFVALDLDRALESLAERYGVPSFRVKRSGDAMRSAHAYIGTTMIEVIEVGDTGPAIYHDYRPAGSDAIRLHHHGHRIDSVDRWEEIVRVIDARGLATPLRGAVMDGHLRYLYVDTREELGIYTEYVCLTGPALTIYDDVPHH